MLSLVAVATARGNDGWVGDRYGWRIRGGVQATVDGGKHWKLIITGAGDVVALAHTGATTGMVALGDQLGADGYWTVDNGRHWYDDSLGEIDSDGLGGHGAYLFAVDSREANGTTLFQAQAWPPRGRALACKSGWQKEGGIPGLHCTETARRSSFVRVSPVIKDTASTGGS